MFEVGGADCFGVLVEQIIGYSNKKVNENGDTLSLQYIS